MIRLLPFSLILFIWVLALVDAITTDDALIRNLPKLGWVFIVFFFPVVGSAMWFILGRPRGAPVPGWTPPPQRRRGVNPPQAPPRGPEDSPDWRDRFRGDEE